MPLDWGSRRAAEGKIEGVEPIADCQQRHVHLKCCLRQRDMTRVAICGEHEGMTSNEGVPIGVQGVLR